MEYEPKSGYTGGEIRALIAPLLEMDPDDINHVAVVANTMDGRLLVFGCNHAPILLGMAASEIQHDQHPGPNDLGAFGKRYQRKGNRLARILRHL